MTRFWRWFRKNTFLGFPVGGGNGMRRRGVAMIIAVYIVAFIMLFAADRIQNSAVSVEMSVNHVDAIKAEYMAKSAVNLALVLLTADLGIELFMNSPVMTGGGAGPGLSDGLGDFWGALNGIPIGGGTVELMASMSEQFNLNENLDEGTLGQLQLFDGDFTLNVTDESSRININFCAQNFRCSEVRNMLSALFNCPAEKEFLDKEIQKEQLESPDQLVALMVDWVDFNEKPDDASGFSGEDDPYQDFTPPYKAKNAPFDSFDELRLIRGWNEKIHAVFLPYITIFPYQPANDARPKVNLNTAPRELLQCLFPESQGECAEKSTLALFNRNTEGINLAEGSSNLKDVLAENLCYKKGGEDSGGGDKENWFSKNSMVFRIEATGSVGDRDKKIMAIIERRLPDEKSKDLASYKILYWKAI